MSINLILTSERKRVTEGRKIRNLEEENLFRSQKTENIKVNN